MPYMELYAKGLHTHPQDICCRSAGDDILVENHNAATSSAHKKRDQDGDDHFDERHTVVSSMPIEIFMYPF